MEKRILYNDIFNIADGRFEHCNISKEVYNNIKDFIHWSIQDGILLSCNDEIDFCKPFLCVEFSEAYLTVYHYNPK